MPFVPNFGGQFDKDLKGGETPSGEAGEESKGGEGGAGQAPFQSQLLDTDQMMQN